MVFMALGVILFVVSPCAVVLSVVAGVLERDAQREGGAARKEERLQLGLADGRHDALDDG